MRPAQIAIFGNDVRRVHEETACDDHDVRLRPGVYDVRYTTVDFRPCAPDAAYWAIATIPCVRLRDGARFGKAGERKMYHLQVHAYTLDVAKAEGGAS